MVIGVRVYGLIIILLGMKLSFWKIIWVGDECLASRYNRIFL